MNIDEKIDLIFSKLQNGTVEDWECLAKQFPDFPNGLDDVCVGRYWITNAIDCASLECVKWIISKGVNLRFVDSEGYSPLHSCIDREFSDKYEMLQLLINSGADINIGTELATMALNSWSPLHLAAARNDLEAIKILLDNKADTTLKTIIDDYCTAEQEATILGKHEAAELIRKVKAQ
ncbi:MAG: ankyrin repeat domain-containing protein [Leptospirales bacterium]|nr:ankyrin repeat domain-containing protein [Leptospirales bacterium]